MHSRLHALGDYLIDLAIRGAIGLALLLPYRWRIPAAGWLARRIVAPLAGFGARVEANLDHALPGLPRAEKRRIAAEVADNAGRSFVEFYSARPLIARLRAQGAPLAGPGADALRAAHRAGRPVLLISGHFGNYGAVRAACALHGMPVGGLYRPMNNRFFNAHYVRATAAFGEPLFARDRRGMAGLVRHLRTGGKAGLLIDQYFDQGAVLTFFGKPAPTATSAAELALKYGAVLIPAYAIRRDDGLDFDIVFEAPVPHSDPARMTQALNDSLEARVRAHMGQWLWSHRRWKPARQRRRAAASTTPGPSS
jgi:Kdo2-lipid IVA lauroyltransferase/acyltransferase